MKIAIPVNEKGSLDDKIALHFGRASNFLIYDTETEGFEIFPNPEVTGGKEFPPDFLYGQGIKAVIVFGLGAMAYGKFKEYNIKMHKAIQGTIAANLQKFEDGNLRELKEEDIDIF
jgi:predicted Fe-Mo cluster-binding NifX family protein